MMKWLSDLILHDFCIDPESEKEDGKAKFVSEASKTAKEAKEVLG